MFSRPSALFSLTRGAKGLRVKVVECRRTSDATQLWYLRCLLRAGATCIGELDGRRSHEPFKRVKQTVKEAEGRTKLRCKRHLDRAGGLDPAQYKAPIRYRIAPAPPSTTHLIVRGNEGGFHCTSIIPQRQEGRLDLEPLEYCFVCNKNLKERETSNFDCLTFSI